MTEVASQKPANQDFQYINLSEVYHLFQDLPLEIAMYDTGGRYKFVNKAYEADESIRKKIIGQDDSYYFKLKGIPVEYAVKRREHFELAMQSKIMVKFTEKLVLTDKNKEFYYKRNFQPIFTNGGGQNIAYIFLFGSDLSAVVLGQREVEYLAYHDKLTGLKNKTAFHEQLKQMEAEVNDKDNAPISAVLFCDLNNFKLVNDSLGHAAGDIILQEVASRLNLCVDKSDVVYRFGGDEFVVILRSIEQELDAGRIADKITKYLSKPFQIIL